MQRELSALRVRSKAGLGVGAAPAGLLLGQCRCPVTCSWRRRGRPRQHSGQLEVLIQHCTCWRGRKENEISLHNTQIRVKDGIGSSPGHRNTICQPPQHTATLQCLRHDHIDGFSGNLLKMMRKLWEIMKDGEAWCAAVHGVAKSHTI